MSSIESSVSDIHGNSKNSSAQDKYENGDQASSSAAWLDLINQLAVAVTDPKKIGFLKDMELAVSKSASMFLINSREKISFWIR